MDTPYGSEMLPVWERPEPQPRAAPVPLSREKIAAAAIRLADAHGLDGLSVRKIAKELGVGPMRLYDYVINRSELLDLMVDVVYARIAEVGGTPRGAPRYWPSPTRPAMPPLIMNGFPTCSAEGRTWDLTRSPWAKRPRRR